MKERDTCFKCGKKGHKAIECGKFQCYNCGKQGHLARDYKVRPRSNQKKRRYSEEDKNERTKKFKEQEDLETKEQGKEEAPQRASLRMHMNKTGDLLLMKEF